MRRVSIIAVVVALLWSCSKSGQSPTAPHNPVPPPQCTLAPGTIDFGPVTTGTSRDTSFLITNTGGGTLSGTVSDTSSVFTIVGPSSYNLSAGQSARLTVRFAPLLAGPRSAAIQASSGCTLGCAGTGVPPVVLACDLSPASLDFGSVAVGQTVDRTFTLTNQSTSSMSGTLSDTSSVFSLPGSPTYTLTPGQSATFVVRLHAATAGTKGDTIRTGQPGCSGVICSAVVQATCAVSTDHLDFGLVRLGSSTTQSFTVTNVGSSTLFGSAGPDGSPGFSVPGGHIDYSLAPGQVLTVPVTFTPVGVEGPYGCTIVTGNTGCSNVTCTGEAQIPCDCAVYPTGIAFGEVVVGDSATRQFTISASGETMIGGTITVSGEGYRVTNLLGYGGTSLGYQVNPGTSQTFNLTYTATRLGPQAGVVAISQTACTRLGAPCDTVHASGSGITTPPPPSCAVSTTDLFVGTLHAGTSKDTTFTLTNTGGGTLSGLIQWLGGSAYPFSIVGPTIYSLEAGQSQTFTVRFTAPAVAPGHTSSYAQNIDLGLPCQGLGYLTVQGTAVP